MIKVTDKSKCSGCTACYAVCPHRAISMKADALGFLYPEVDMDICTDCGLCERKCDFVSAKLSSKSFPEKLPVYAARNADPKVLESSQSGGVFPALAKAVISVGGVVYGAAFRHDFTVAHKRSADLKGCFAFRGSKYVQSELGDSFINVRNDLEDGKTVLFSGTPCQVAGLLSYLPERLHHNLVTVDFICHGVPSPAVWKDYVQYMKRKGEIVSVSFRDKAAGGWKVHAESFTYAHGRKVFRETYKVMYYKNVMLRRSCASCPYDYTGRKSDIVMADFWGIEEFLTHWDGNSGTSMLIALSAKGREWVARASEDLAMEAAEVPSELISRRNPNLMRPSKIYHESRMFEESYPEKGFMYAARRWGDLGWRYRAWKLKVLIRKMTGRK